MIRTALFLIISILISTQPAFAQEQENLFFLHHSTGRNLIAQGDVRSWLDNWNLENGSNYVLWDHDYNYIGLTNPQGVDTSRCYDIPNDNTDPDGLHVLWATANSARDSILANHQVVAFKSCYPASGIDSAGELTQYKTWYLAMRDFFDSKPNTTFVVMSQPPLHRLATTVADADRARAFATWLSSDQYLAGHNNLRCFNLFDKWAQPDDGSAIRNMLRPEFERSSTNSDSHPNEHANQTVGPVFAAFLVQSARLPAERTNLGGVKSLYR